VRLTATLIKSTVVAALGGLLFGFDTAVISGTTAGLKTTFHLSTHWVVNAAISYGFPAVAAYSRGAPFAFFSAMMLVMFFVVLFYYPETKGVTLEDMQRKLGIA
jgi:hypothetical protein